MTMLTGPTGSTGTCARNLPQHFNGCTCTAAPGDVTAEVDVWLDVPQHLDEPVTSTPATVEVLDADGYPVAVTPGVVNSQARLAYSHGQCLALAVAVSEETGWPVYLRMAHGRVGRKSTDYLIHAMVQRPDGSLIDINGARQPGDWVGSGREIEPQIIPSSDAMSLLKTHMAAMQTQDIETARTFVGPVVDRADSPPYTGFFSHNDGPPSPDSAIQGGKTLGTFENLSSNGGHLHYEEYGDHIVIRDLHVEEHQSGRGVDDILMDRLVETAPPGTTFSISMNTPESDAWADAYERRTGVRVDLEPNPEA